MRLLLLVLFVAITSPLVAQTKGYTFVFLHKKPDAEDMPKAQLDKLMEGHMANINRLAQEGKLVVAGPFEGGGGIFIFNTGTVVEAKQWLSTDPGVQANRWNVELLPYTPIIGSVCAVKEPYEMVTYQFVRFIPIVTKETAGDYPQLLARHDDYLKQLQKSLSVVTQASFGKTEGGIIIVRGDFDQKLIDADPGVAEGLLQTYVNRLYIAKGSFCEK